MKNLGGDKINTVFDLRHSRLQQAYDINGGELIPTTWVDSLPLSGYSFGDIPTRLLFDWGTTNFQSLVHANDMYYRADTTATVQPFDSTLTAQTSITLPSTGGHKNDGCYYDGKIYWLDGTADDSKSVYVWDIANNTVTQVTLPITDNPNGSKRVVAGICNTDTEGYMYLVSRDQYNNSDISHQTGDKMCVYRYNVTGNTAELVADFDWDCVYVQGATYVDGKLYVSCNSPTTGSASNYTGITLKIITVKTWSMEELTCAGDFEPQGADNIVIGERSYIYTGLNKYGTTNKVLIMGAV